MDHVTPERRSALMARILGKNTKPEIAVRRIVWRLGYRYSLHNHRLPGSPDLVLTRHRKILFVHGCFWHSHPGCKKAKPPKTRLDYWMPKLAANAERDRRKESDLRKLGWDVLVIWQCELHEPEELEAKLSRFMKKPCCTLLDRPRLTKRSAD